MRSVSRGMASIVGQSSYELTYEIKRSEVADRGFTSPSCFVDSSSDSAMKLTVVVNVGFMVGSFS